MNTWAFTVDQNVVFGPGSLVQDHLLASGCWHTIKTRGAAR